MTKPQSLDYLREWGTRIANDRHEFIGCLCASLKAGQITMQAIPSTCGPAYAQTMIARLWP